MPITTAIQILQQNHYVLLNEEHDLHLSLIFANLSIEKENYYQMLNKFLSCNDLCDNNIPCPLTGVQNGLISVEVQKYLTNFYSYHKITEKELEKANFR